MPQSIIYYLDEIAFLKQNFFRMNNNQLLDEINSMRQNPLKLSALIHQCRRLGLKRGIQIRWNESDIKYLIKNYRQIGNIELAEILTNRRKTYRVINNKKVYRVYTKKHVEKKAKLLHLKRTDKELSDIRQRNIESGRVTVITSEDNYWTNGTMIPFEEETIRLWKINGYLLRFIKIDGRFTPYTRWFYHNFINPVRDDQKVYHIDMDRINDEPDNLELRTCQISHFKDYKRALPLIRNRISIHLKSDYSSREEEKEWHKQLSHLRAIERLIKAKLERISNRKYSIYKGQMIEV